MYIDFNTIRKREEGLIIFDIVLTLLGFAVGVVSLIIGILSICK